MHPDLDRVLITEAEIAQRVAELGCEISQAHAGHEVLLIAILRGGAIFAADLIRQITVPTALDFVAVSSYGEATSTSGSVRVLKDVQEELTGRHVILVEDIVDTGLTTSFLLKFYRRRGPASIEVCVLLDKPSRRECETQLDYQGFEVPDEFVVGYGLDFRQRYRGLPYIGVLKPEVIGEAGIA